MDWYQLETSSSLISWRMKEHGSLQVGSTLGLEADLQAQKVCDLQVKLALAEGDTLGKSAHSSQPSEQLGHESSAQKGDFPGCQQPPLHQRTALICFVNSKHFLEFLLKFCLQSKSH